MSNCLKSSFNTSPGVSCFSQLSLPPSPRDGIPSLESSSQGGGGPCAWNTPPLTAIPNTLAWEEPFELGSVSPTDEAERLVPPAVAFAELKGLLAENCEKGAKSLVQGVPSRDCGEQSRHPSARSAFWLRPFELELLVKLRHRANAASATQIEEAAAAAAAAFQRQKFGCLAQDGASSPSCDEGVMTPPVAGRDGAKGPLEEQRDSVVSDAASAMKNPRLCPFGPLFVAAASGAKEDSFEEAPHSLQEPERQCLPSKSHTFDAWSEGNQSQEGAVRFAWHPSSCAEAKAKTPSSSQAAPSRTEALLQQEEIDHQQKEIDLQQKEIDLQQEEIDHQQEGIDLQQEGIDHQQEEIDHQQEGIAPCSVTAAARASAAGALIAIQKRTQQHHEPPPSAAAASTTVSSAPEKSSFHRLSQGASGTHLYTPPHSLPNTTAASPQALLSVVAAATHQPFPRISPSREPAERPSAAEMLPPAVPLEQLPSSAPEEKSTRACPSPLPGLKEYSEHPFFQYQEEGSAVASAEAARQAVKHAAAALPQFEGGPFPPPRLSPSRFDEPSTPQRPLEVLNSAAASPYLTPPRPPARLPCAPGLLESAVLELSTPSSGSAASRRGTLKSSARRPASSLSRTIIEATARRFNPLPFGRPLTTPKKQSAWSGAASPPENKRGVGGSQALENCAVDWAEAFAAGGRRCQEGGFERRGRLKQESDCQSLEQPLHHPQRRRERLLQRLQGSASSTAPDGRVEEGVCNQRPHNAGGFSADVQEVPASERVSVCDAAAACASAGGSTAGERLLRVAFSPYQVQQLLRRGAYGFHLEGLLWMLEREGRLLPCEKEASSRHHEDIDSFFFPGDLSRGAYFARGGLLADDGGLCIRMQPVALIAATLPTGDLEFSREVSGAGNCCERGADLRSERDDLEEGEEVLASLVLTPASILPQWEAEIHRLCGMKLRVLNMQRHLRETGCPLITPSVLQGAHVVLVSYEALEDVGCLCKRPPYDQRAPRRQRQEAWQSRQRSRTQLPSQDLCMQHAAGEGEADLSRGDGLFMPSCTPFDAELGGGSEDVEERRIATPGKPQCFAARKKHRDVDSPPKLPSLPSSPSPFYRKLPMLPSTPESQTSKRRRGGSAKGKCSTPKTASQSHVSLWGPQRPRCSCMQCFLLARKWHRLVLDEVHLLLGREKLADTVKAIAAPYRWGLTTALGEAPPWEPPPARGSSSDLQERHGARLWEVGFFVQDPSGLLQLVGLKQSERELQMEGRDREVVRIEACFCGSTEAAATCCEEDTSGGGATRQRAWRAVLRRTQSDLRQRQERGKLLCRDAAALLQRMQIQVRLIQPVLPDICVTFQMLSFASTHEMEVYRRLEETAVAQLATRRQKVSLHPLEWILRLRQAALHCTLLGDVADVSQRAALCLRSDLLESSVTAGVGSPERRRKRLSIRSPGHPIDEQLQIGKDTTHEEFLCLGFPQAAAEESAAAHSTKTQAIVAAVTDILQENCAAKIVIASTFPAFLALLEPHLAQVFRRLDPAGSGIGNKILRITGHTSIECSAHAIRKFVTESHGAVLLVPAFSSALHGVDGLQGAGHLLACEPFMSPWRLRQLVGHLAHIRQMEKKLSVRIFFVRDTVEHRILRLRPPIGFTGRPSIISCAGSAAADESFLCQQSAESIFAPFDDTHALLGINS
ncbi:hypothetical protein cyc_01611 [Cyclospora cayetanensis]|uniref:SNF2 N-terminal domain-containing protein n=1 Tax=Cyclospora cayetanensis TaxID=88456 RepID=A0A1D3D926_9EIME|nr:hypothetical protein cyc_01611 [Cyclospora cayetanensis]